MVCTVYCAMPSDRWVDIDNNGTISAGTEAGLTDCASAKYAVTMNGSTVHKTSQDIGKQFGYVHVDHFVFLHERDLRSWLHYAEEIRNAFVTSCAVMSCCSQTPAEYLEIRHIGLVGACDMGFGLFATSRIEAGTVIGDYKGLVKRCKTSSAYSMSYPSLDGDYEIDAKEYGNLMRFINHSDNPNVSFVPSSAASFPLISICVVSAIKSLLSSIFSLILECCDVLFVVQIATRLIDVSDEVTASYGNGYWTKRCKLSPDS